MARSEAQWRQAVRTAPVEGIEALAAELKSDELDPVLRGGLWHLLGWRCLCAGQRARAMLLYRSAIEDRRRSGQRIGAVESLVALAQLQEADRQFAATAATLDELSESVYPYTWLGMRLLFERARLAETLGDQHQAARLASLAKRRHEATFGQPPSCNALDWDDHEAWDLHYLRSLRDGWGPGMFVTLAAVASGAALHGRRIWVPGCGLSLAPNMLAALGFEVCASDVSTVAIEHMERCTPQIAPDVARLVAEEAKRWPDVAELRAPARPGPLRWLVHDFRGPWIGPAFDVIFNLNALAGLPPGSLHAAARTFFSALRPGGCLIVETMNAGDRLLDIASALLTAGFHWPDVDALLEYCSALAAAPSPRERVRLRSRLARARAAALERARGEDSWGTLRHLYFIEGSG